LMPRKHAAAWAGMKKRAEIARRMFARAASRCRRGAIQHQEPRYGGLASARKIR
jgi:hypothetical protein